MDGVRRGSSQEEEEGERLWGVKTCESRSVSSVGLEVVSVGTALLL